MRLRGLVVGLIASTIYRRSAPPVLRAPASRVRAGSSQPSVTSVRCGRSVISPGCKTAGGILHPWRKARSILLGALVLVWAFHCQAIIRATWTGERVGPYQPVNLIAVAFYLAAPRDGPMGSHGEFDWLELLFHWQTQMCMVLLMLCSVDRLWKSPSCRLYSSGSELRRQASSGA